MASSNSSVIDAPTTGLADVVAQISVEQKMRAALRTEFERKTQAANERIAHLQHRRDLLAASSLTNDQISLAKSVIRLVGPVSESAEGAFDAALAAIAEGGQKLRSVYIGAKRYSGYHQRCDCQYGFGPSHGSIVFAVELMPDVRDRACWPEPGATLPDEQPLTQVERDAAVAYLLAERAVGGRNER